MSVDTKMQNTKSYPVISYHTQKSERDPFSIHDSRLSYNCDGGRPTKKRV